MTYPFVKAAFDYGARKGPVRAFVVHMAEGGGTVGFLSRSPTRGVSVHYVIEYSGRIVQMLLEDHASGSINPGDLRTTDGPAPYGASVGKAVLGDWWRDPNSAIITVEIEGFAAAGPNAAQAAALATLVADVRSRNPGIGLLGHRDFTSTKACPGAHIDWPGLGGHGPAAEDPMAVIKVGNRGPFTVELSAGDQLYDEAFQPTRTAPATETWPGLFYTGTGYVALDHAGRLAFVKSDQVVVTSPPSTAALEAKIAAARAALA